MKRLVLTLLVFFMFCSTWSIGAYAEEPRVRVETYPHWTAGDLAIYLFDFPGDGVTYSGDTIRIRVAVWGATEDNPITILLNGEEAARIEGPGMFTYEWSLRGSYHTLIRCEVKIFQQAAFNVKAPPPPAPVILLDEFYAKLEQQRSTMMLAMVGACAVGALFGLEALKRTKIRTPWVLPAPGVGILLGIRYLPDLYMLIPWGVAFGIVYQLANPYARELVLLSLEDHQVDGSRKLTIDDEGKAVTGIGPQYWRQGFIVRKDIKVEDEYPVTLHHEGLYQGVVLEKIEENDSQVTVKCSKALAQLIRTSGALKEATDLANEYWEKNLDLENLGVLKMEKEIGRRTKANVTAIFEGMEAKEDAG